MTARESLKKMRSRIFTVPNELTLLRLAFLPFFIIAIEYDRYFAALAILVVSGLTDALDGYLARSLDQKTALGAYLDPIADKLLMSTSYLVLALKGRIGWWLAILVLGRDVLLLVACAVILITVGYRPFPPSIWGKLTTALRNFPDHPGAGDGGVEPAEPVDGAGGLLVRCRLSGGDFRAALQHCGFKAVGRRSIGNKVPGPKPTIRYGRARRLAKPWRSWR